MAHEQGAYVLVDGAQLVPHCPVNMGSTEDQDRIDFLAFSGHKMYAPFGSGILIGPKSVFREGKPDIRGGGAIDLVSRDFVLWRGPPNKEEAGSPNSLGIVTMAKAAQTISANMEQITTHEKEMAEYTHERLSSVPHLILYGPDDMDNRLGLFTFNLPQIHHNLLSAVLSNEFGISTRSGCFCAHPYMIRLLDISREDLRSVKREVQRGVTANLAGAVRVSLGLYNCKEDIDLLADALLRISENPQEYRARYNQDKNTGEFFSKDRNFNYQDYFSLRE